MLCVFEKNFWKAGIWGFRRQKNMGSARRILNIVKIKNRKEIPGTLLQEHCGRSICKREYFRKPILELTISLIWIKTSKYLIMENLQTRMMRKKTARPFSFCPPFFPGGSQTGFSAKLSIPNVNSTKIEYFLKLNLKISNTNKFNWINRHNSTEFEEEFENRTFQQDLAVLCKY